MASISGQGLNTICRRKEDAEITEYAEKTGRIENKGSKGMNTHPATLLVSTIVFFLRDLR
jgi:hypothetical protein